MVPLIKDPESTVKKPAFTKWRNGTSVSTTAFSYTEWDNRQRMLFDLKKDPDENKNVAEDPAYKEKAEEMSKMLGDGLDQMPRGMF